MRAQGGPESGGELDGGAVLLRLPPPGRVEGDDAPAVTHLCGAKVARGVVAAGGADADESVEPQVDESFDALDREAARHGGLFAECAAEARALLATETADDSVPLHGDCHHRNVLDGGAWGWLAIDPKDRFGDRGFDDALILCNPDLPRAADTELFAEHLARVAARSGIPPPRLARAGLSAAWFLEDGDTAGAEHDFAIARTAKAWWANATG